MSISNSLLQKPLYLPEDLGKPLPDSIHAVSVCLPTWQDVIGYEEKDPRVINAMKCGYPRFVIHPLVQQLFDYCTAKYALEEETCFVFPSFKVAKQAIKFIESHAEVQCRIQDLGKYDLSCVVLPKIAYDLAKAYWQHSGEIVSSRLAQQVLDELNENLPPLQPRLNEQAQEAKLIIKKRIAELTDESESNVYLYPSGMSAIYAAYTLLQNRAPGLKTVQLGFPYTDTLKIQQKFHSVASPEEGLHFLFNADDNDLQRLEHILCNEKIAGLLCEIPSNPLLKTPDWKSLTLLAKKYDFPIVIDDTVGTFANLSMAPTPDLLTSSLTKYFSGQGDVMAGSMVVSSKSKYFSEFTQQQESYDDLLWCQDAIIVEQNSANFLERIEKINENAELLSDFLHEHEAIQTVYYPKYDATANFTKVKNNKAGFGGLLSILVKDAKELAPKFYDALEVCKGPSLGTNYTIACPYTLLAHYQELDFADGCGVSPYLIRVSVGLEDANDLIKRFERALKSIT